MGKVRWDVRWVKIVGWYGGWVRWAGTVGGYVGWYEIKNVSLKSRNFGDLELDIGTDGSFCSIKSYNFSKKNTHHPQLLFTSQKV